LSSQGWLSTGRISAWQWICRSAFKHPTNNYPLVNYHSYWKLPFIVDWPIKNGDFP
jgi:hypothetical protein